MTISKLRQLANWHHSACALDQLAAQHILNLSTPSSESQVKTSEGLKKKAAFHGEAAVELDALADAFQALCSGAAVDLKKSICG